MGIYKVNASLNDKSRMMKLKLFLFFVERVKGRKSLSRSCIAALSLGIDFFLLKKVASQNYSLTSVNERQTRAHLELNKSFKYKKLRHFLDFQTPKSELNMMIDRKN